MKKVLVTGGTGYIGSHTVVALLEKGYPVLIADDLSNSSEEVVEKIRSITGIRPEFEQIDLADQLLTADFFSRHQDLDAVIHFAAKKAVGESVEKPLLYYRNNLMALLNVLQGMKDNRISSLVFSSSCTVYGQPAELPVRENAPMQKALSPYGNTKRISEEIIGDFCVAEGIRASLLRYFNPIGAHSTALIGELPNGTPNNLMPYITQTAIGKHEFLRIWGKDYNTPDGTAIRDYLHVMDLAEAHLKALERLSMQITESAVEVFNLGTGTGYSVLEVVASFEKMTGIALPCRILDRRPGDVEAVWADPALANNVLQWRATRSLDEMTLSAWQWELALEGERKRKSKTQS